MPNYSPIFPNGKQRQKLLPLYKSPKRKAEATPVKGKLSYSEKKEYDQIEGKILELEQEVQKLNHSLENKEIAENPTRLQEICSQVGLAKTGLNNSTYAGKSWEKSSEGNKKAPKKTNHFFGAYNGALRLEICLLKKTS